MVCSGRTKFKTRNGKLWLIPQSLDDTALSKIRILGKGKDIEEYVNMYIEYLSQFSVGWRSLTSSDGQTGVTIVFPTYAGSRQAG
jgi:hypothetical protein